MGECGEPGKKEKKTLHIRPGNFRDISKTSSVTTSSGAVNADLKHRNPRKAQRSFKMKPVYVLGRSRGALSHLVTHELAALPEQPAVPRIVYLLRSDKKLRTFLNHDSTLTLTQYSPSHAMHVTQMQLMSACAPPQYDSGELAHIESMVCSFNRARDVTELHKYKKCFNPQSSVLLLETDRSFLDSMKTLLWKNSELRPNLYQSISDIRCWSTGDFHTGVIGDGSMKIAKIPRDLTDMDSYEYDLGANIHQEGELMEMMSRANGLNTTFIKYTDFVHLQYESMIIKTAVGSLTGLYDCTNGELLKMKHTTRLLEHVIKECLKIIASSDPMLMKLPNATVMLNSDRILDLALTLLKKTQKESSLMRRQVSLWNSTEITNTTGYFSYMARRSKTTAIHINMLNKMLEAKTSLVGLRGQEVLLDDEF